RHPRPKHPHARPSPSLRLSLRTPIPPRPQPVGAAAPKIKFAERTQDVVENTGQPHLTNPTQNPSYWCAMPCGADPRVRLPRHPHQRLRRPPVPGPLIHRHSAKTLIEIDGRLVPVEHAPLQPPAAALLRNLRKLNQ